MLSACHPLDVVCWAAMAMKWDFPTPSLFWASTRTGHGDTSASQRGLRRAAELSCDWEELSSFFPLTRLVYGTELTWVHLAAPPLGNLCRMLVWGPLRRAGAGAGSQIPLPSRRPVAFTESPDLGPMLSQQDGGHIPPKDELHHRCGFTTLCQPCQRPHQARSILRAEAGWRHHPSLALAFWFPAVPSSDEGLHKEQLSESWG